MKRKLATLVAIGMLGTMGLAACSGSDAKGSDGQSGSAEGSPAGTLNFYTDKAAWKSDFEKMNVASEEAIGVDLKTTGYSDANQYDAFIKQAMRTKESPGLFTWHTGETLQDLVADGLIAETTDIWKDAIGEGWVTEELRDAYTIDDKQYCVPLNVAYWVMFYNKQIFEDNGFNEPETYEELTSMVETLKGKGIAPIYQMTFLFNFPWIEHLIASTNPDLWYGLQDGSIAWNDPRIIDIWNTWNDEEHAGWFTDPALDVDPALGLKQGDYAMIPFGTFYAGNLAGAGVEESEYGAFLIPPVNASLDKFPVAFETGPLCVAEKSEQRDMGLEYSKWWMSPEAQSAWSEARGDVPYNPFAKTANAVLQGISDSVDQKGLLYDRFIEAMPTPVVTAGDEAFSAFMANPTDPAAYADKMQKVAEKYWSGK